MFRRYFKKIIAAQIRAAKSAKEIDAIVAAISDIWDDKIPEKMAPVIAGTKRALEMRAHFRAVKGSKIFGADFSTTCEGYCCEDCSNNDRNTAGSFCGGSNCGWCHGAVTVWVDGIPYGQGGCDYNDLHADDEDDYSSSSDEEEYEPVDTGSIDEWAEED